MQHTVLILRSFIGDGCTGAWRSGDRMWNKNEDENGCVVAGDARVMIM
jgi:hypothetical protein